MPCADLLVDLVRAGSHGDQVRFKRAVEALVAEERAKHHHVLADRLAENLSANGSGASAPLVPRDAQVQQLLLEVVPRKSLGDLILPEVVWTACRELIEEQHRAELLRSYGLEPRHRVLLAGPPGNGKTSVAEALAEGLMVPLLAVRYEGTIGSFLGETAGRLERIFTHARTRRCVLFFDEFDVIGKERGDAHETGEIKRVVSSLLLQIDTLPSHVVVVAASNHAELLDRAAWRRFQVRLHLPPPGHKERVEWFRRFAARFDQPLGSTPEELAKVMMDASFAELEDLGLDIQRRFVLALPGGDVKTIVRERIAQWQARFTAASALAKTTGARRSASRHAG
jgi:SpoVK/Ycf46/Vps4 family AAA+-type ATPase